MGELTWQDEANDTERTTLAIGRARPYNQELALIYEDWIMGLALSRFRWEGLPETCNERYLEWTLLTEGVATIAKNAGVWYSLQAIQQGQPNKYDLPQRWRAMAMPESPISPAIGATALLSTTTSCAPPHVEAVGVRAPSGAVRSHL